MKTNKEKIIFTEHPIISGILISIIAPAIIKWISLFTNEKSAYNIIVNKIWNFFVADIKLPIWLLFLISGIMLFLLTKFIIDLVVKRKIKKNIKYPKDYYDQDVIDGILWKIDYELYGNNVSKITACCKDCIIPLDEKYGNYKCIKCGNDHNIYSSEKYGYCQNTYTYERKVLADILSNINTGSWKELYSNKQIS